MSRDDVIRMGEESGFHIVGTSICVGYDGEEDIQVLERFAALVAAAEREECAKVSEAHSEVSSWPVIIANAIRARGQA